MSRRSRPGNAGTTTPGNTTPDNTAPGASTVGDTAARTARVGITVDGRPVTVAGGGTIAGALLAAGIPAWRRTRRAGAPRGIYCGIGVCFDCLVTVNGVHGVRACLAPVRDGDRIETEDGSGHAELAV